jgi:hypothetical protein
MLADTLIDLHVESMELPRTMVTNVVYAKINKLSDRGFLDWGVSPRGAWITKEGKQYLSSLDEKRL